MGEDQMILVLAEVDQDGSVSRHSWELVGLASELALQLRRTFAALLMGSGIGAAGRELAEGGAQKVFLADETRLASYDPDSYLAIAKDVCGQYPVDLFLAGHTAMGLDLFPRLAMDLGAGLVTDCIGLEVDATDGLLFKKPIYGGNAIASFKNERPPRLATVRARVGEAPGSGSPRGEVASVPVRLEASRITVGERVREEKQLRLEEAPVVVSGGRGIGGPEGFERLRELAEILGGVVGASRPPCDSGWVPPTDQVGITGKVVAPDLYIAVGISGTTQHLSGMSESKKIIAINKDPDAYIFKVADYGAVGDWRQVLPSFSEEIRKSIEGRG